MFFAKDNALLITQLYDQIQALADHLGVDLSEGDLLRVSSDGTSVTLISWPSPEVPGAVVGWPLNKGDEGWVLLFGSVRAHDEAVKTKAGKRIDLTSRLQTVPPSKL